MEHEPEHSGEEGEKWLAITPIRGDEESSASLSATEAGRWALVLEARGIPHQTVPGETGWLLLVPAGELETAREELLRFEEENRNWPPPAPQENPLVENTLVTLSILILLATFHNFTLIDMSRYGFPPTDWVELGSAQAARIMYGQWWRTVTALTLHADWVHLAGNLAIGGFFIVHLCRDLGSGLAWSLILGSGILGNLANAWLQPSYHSSIGSSTAVFGTLGILAAVNLIRYRNYRRRRWLLPFAAALALLALLGTEGKRTDLGAHLFGFGFGIGFGLLAEFLVGRYGRPGRVLNALLAGACISMVIAAWWVALVLG